MIKPYKQQEGKVKPCQWQGARSNDRGATTSTAVTKCPCHTDESSSYWTKPSLFTLAANLSSYLAGCATAGSREIQYSLSNALDSP